MFKKKKPTRPPQALAKMAGARCEMYELMVGIFNQLPDAALLKRIKTREFENRFREFSGAAHIRDYRFRMEKNPPETIINELSVDRTRILRGTGPNDLKPPHEGCYSMDCDLGSAAIQVKRYYRAAGLIPDTSVCESPDYFCVQLDFMKQLCRREQRLRSSNQDAGENIACQGAFLKKHLGSWVGDFCEQVQKHALTDFYRGFALILNEFIKKDIQYLHHRVN
jgi:putative dimethyl sulfoxide reductase chaperone